MSRWQAAIIWSERTLGASKTEPGGVAPYHFLASSKGKLAEITAQLLDRDIPTPNYLRFEAVRAVNRIAKADTPPHERLARRLQLVRKLRERVARELSQRGHVMREAEP
jgi:hypothetical protein